MQLWANAKINLTLDITGKKKNGYHLLDSVMQSISLCDMITIEKREEISVLCSDASVLGEKNIAHKAAQKFFEFTGIEGGCVISVSKNIPMAAGLGGGSADAAAVILGLDKIYETNLSEKQLIKIALSVGADVPFCMLGGTSRVRGIGERVEKLADIPECVFLIIKQGDKLSTADMYKKFDQMKIKRRDTKRILRAIEHQSLQEITDNIGNSFSPLFDNERLLSLIKRTGALAVSLSGSGPAVFGIYKNMDMAKRAREALKDFGYEPIMATPENCGVKFE